ncbi:hypothetical protein CXB51_017231 [Gossypium anomalum]|uniref:RNase H type-1 domain-containing protein n=1 Tax=Gossypium anomalum TaxID=47600 RepID=A0A8J5YGV1_9ROSI|nr:hypothetical protein CXB51_017231 [Gossypium anomalum]
MSWDRMCYPKGMEGLGFRDLRCFNVALLGRQVWRLINCKDSLCYKVLSAKYFPNGDVFHPKSMDKPSFTWQSIAKAARVLYEGFSWNVGNGHDHLPTYEKIARIHGEFNNTCPRIEDVARVLDKKEISDFIIVFWNKPILPRPVMKKTWRKPIQGVIKINFDATITGNKMSYGVVARDHDGFVLGS